MFTKSGQFVEIAYPGIADLSLAPVAWLQSDVVDLPMPLAAFLSVSPKRVMLGL